ncbi:MAG TPA: amidohydrolase family protein [Candidatus Acidoferrales bacterium]|nr:amidohydrolase family protein [Candidatus Acidoferrales bacterium]
MTALAKRLRPVAMLLAAALWTAPALRAQATPLPAGAAGPLYNRLLNEISKIPIIDNHSHPGFPTDSDVDAMVLPPGGTTVLRLRDSNPELVAADRALFGYPYSDFSPEHVRWLEQKKAELRKTWGNQYFTHILDQVGIQYCLANRVAMPAYLDSKRFRWVFFADSFLFPFNNREPEARSPDNAVYIPLQEKVLERYLRQAGLATLPASLDGYEAFLRRILEENRKQGALAVKFEVAYFRPLRFSDPPRSRALAIYAKYHAGGAPSADDYQVFQDYILRNIVREAASLHLAVHFHTAVGVGNYFNLAEDNVMNLENLLRDPRYGSVHFVLLHGGYPFEREAIWFAAMPNVYLDSSLMELYMYPWQFRTSLREWLELYPERVMFGSDAFPFGEGLGVEEIYWLAVQSVRASLAADLADMIAENEMNEAQALALARDYLHDNAARLYGLH